MEPEDLEMALAPPKGPNAYQFNTVPLFGCKLFTDRWGLHAFLEAVAAEADAVPEAQKAAALALWQLDLAMPDGQGHQLVDRLDEFYPGLRKAVGAALRELAGREAGHRGTIVFLNGKVQAWPEHAAEHPSDFYSTEVTTATPGYEAIVRAEVEAYEKEVATVRAKEATEHHSIMAEQLQSNPTWVLDQVAKICTHLQGQADLSKSEMAAILVPVQVQVGKWMRQNDSHVALAIEKLGRPTLLFLGFGLENGAITYPEESVSPQ